MTTAMTEDQMHAAWRNRELTRLTEAELAYIVDENIEPGYNDYPARAVLHAFRAGMVAGRKAALAAAEPGK